MTRDSPDRSLNRGKCVIKRSRPESSPTEDRKSCDEKSTCHLMLRLSSHASFHLLSWPAGSSVLDHICLYVCVPVQGFAFHSMREYCHLMMLLCLFRAGLRLLAFVCVYVWTSFVCLCLCTCSGRLLAFDWGFRHLMLLFPFLSWPSASFLFGYIGVGVCVSVWGSLVIWFGLLSCYASAAFFLELAFGRSVSVSVYLLGASLGICFWALSSYAPHVFSRAGLWPAPFWPTSASSACLSGVSHAIWWRLLSPLLLVSFFELAFGPSCVCLCICVAYLGLSMYCLGIFMTLVLYFCNLSHPSETYLCSSSLRLFTNVSISSIGPSRRSGATSGRLG